MSKGIFSIKTVPMRPWQPDHSRSSSSRTLVLPYSGMSQPSGCCALGDTYYAGLSDASKRSFAVQGGELSRSEAMRLLALEGMDDAMALRRWDDRAKVHGVEVPNLDAYRQVVLDQLL